MVKRPRETDKNNQNKNTDENHKFNTWASILTTRGLGTAALEYIHWKDPMVIYAFKKQR